MRRKSQQNESQINIWRLKIDMPKSNIYHEYICICIWWQNFDAIENKQMNYMIRSNRKSVRNTDIIKHHHLYIKFNQRNLWTHMQSVRPCMCVRVNWFFLWRNLMKALRNQAVNQFIGFIRFKFDEIFSIWHTFRRFPNENSTIYFVGENICHERKCIHEKTLNHCSLAWFIQNNTKFFFFLLSQTGQIIFNKNSRTRFLVSILIKNSTIIHNTQNAFFF